MAKRNAVRLNRRPSAGLADQIRARIIDSGLSYYRVAIDSGLSESTIGRMMKGVNEPTLAVAEAIVATLGSRIIIAPKEK